MLITIGDMTVAVTFDESWYYFFDSRARNSKNGSPDARGFAVLMHFHDVHKVLQCFIQNYNNIDFNASPVVF